MIITSRYRPPDITCPYCLCQQRPDIEDLCFGEPSNYWFVCKECDYEIRVNGIDYPQRWRDVAEGK